jgi:hypothetical protein
VEKFTGTLTLDDGERVPVDLGLDEGFLSLRTQGNLIGIWPVKYCRVSRSARGAVILSLDGEKAVFEPQDPSGFATVAAHRFRSSTLADRISVVRDIATVEGSSSSVSPRSSESDRHASVRRMLGWTIGTVAVVLALVAAGWVLGWMGDDDPRQFGSPAFTVPPTIISPPPLFEQTVDEFATEWNLAAAAFGVPVQIRGVLVPGLFESQLTPYLTLQGRTGSDGTIASVILVIDPSGDTDDDRNALAALGVAIAVANPELTSEERGEVLAAMGLSVRSPDLGDLDGSLEVGDTAYSISYIAAFNALLFVINPA